MTDGQSDIDYGEDDMHLEPDWGRSEGRGAIRRQRLSADDVRDIRRTARPTNYDLLAYRYDVCRSHIIAVAKGRARKDVR